MSSTLDIDRALEIQQLYEEIRELKRQKNAVILAHYYMSPELQVTHAEGGIADFVGDSLGLSLEATKVTHPNIIFCGVRFMAETAKIVNPEKQVFLPDSEAGCSLAASITPADVRALRQRYPGRPVISYVNTYADVKAESDICCTSRNALRIVESYDQEELIFLPDVYMGANLQRQISEQSSKKLILWNGRCEVHEQFAESLLTKVCAENPEAEVLLHWEVPQPSVEAGLAHNRGVLGSTNDIIRHVGESSAHSFILASECDLGATLKTMYPAKSFITPCIKCPYMKKITLENTKAALLSIGNDGSSASSANYEITLDADIMTRALLPIQRMLSFA